MMCRHGVELHFVIIIKYYIVNRKYEICQITVQ